MIVKTIGAKGLGSYGRLINYILRDEAALRDKDGNLITIQHNVFGTPKEIEGQFKDNEARRLHRRINNNVLLHAILALSEKNKEDITPEMLEHLSKEFISMVDPNSLAYGAIHMDGNPHAHVIISGSNMLGQSTRMSRDQFQRIKQELQALQIRDYPELEDSVVEHGGGHMAKSNVEYQIGRAGRTSRKAELKDLLSVSFDLAQSRDEFFNLLAEDGLNVYERGGQVKGIEDECRNYRFETLDINMQELEKREERFNELEIIHEHKETIKLDDISIEDQRMRELDELG
jgi:hypothetical protein